MRTAPLLPRPWRPVAALAWLASAFVLAVLSWHFMHAPATNLPDSVASAQVTARLAAHPHALAVASRLGSPSAVVVGSLVLGALCLVARRPRAALFALLAPPAAGAVTELVLKPLVHRQQHVDALLFPSGHTTGAFALALTVVVLVLPREDTRLVSALARLVVGGAALAAATVVAVAVVALGWHYVTDTVGGAVTALVVVVGMAASIDAAAAGLARSRREPAYEY